MGGIPRPGPEHARLALLAGDWIGEETIVPTPFDGISGNAIGHVHARMALDGFYLVTDYSQERHGGVPFQGHGVWSWDAGRRAYAMHWFDSTGVDHGAPFRGTWDGNRLVLVHDAPGLRQSRHAYVVGDGEYELRMEVSVDGARWTTFLIGHYRRAPRGR